MSPITGSMLRRIQEGWEHTKTNGLNGLQVLFTWAKEDIKIGWAFN